MTLQGLHDRLQFNYVNPEDDNKIYQNVGETVIFLFLIL